MKNVNDDKYVYYIYKITLLCGSLTGHYYIGKRKYKIPTYYTKDDFVLKLTQNPMLDCYRGSGKIINNYFKKYFPKFKETFDKEIIKFSNTFEENYKNEELIIGDLWKTDAKCLNLIKGGICVQNPESVSEQVKLYNKTHINNYTGHKHTERAKELDRQAAIERWKNPEYRQKMSVKLKEYWKTHNSPNAGKHLSEERKRHLSMINVGRPNPKNTGKNNGMFGKIPANAKPVILLDIKTGEELAEFPSSDAAARHFKIKSGSSIRAAIIGKSKSSCGYKWKYKE